MTRKTSFAPLLAAAFLALLACPLAAHAAGRFVVAFQRQLSAWENSANTGCIGGHVCRVWVFDENGDPVPDIQLKTTWDILMGATDYDGRCEITVNMGDDFDLVCLDSLGATSEATLLMTSDRPECWGHYSFEVAFLYKTDAANPGAFDLDMNGSWNEPSPAPQDDDAPYTKSLAYSGVDPTDYWSDQSYWGNWQNPPSYFGQTFVATGDRVISARVNGIIGGNDLLSWKLRIVTFPALQPVGTETEVPVRFPFGWEAFWGVNDCPVTPGQTYMLQVWRDPGGMNIYHVTSDVYPDGRYYEGTTAFPGFDLNGHICCMTYGGDDPPPVNDVNAPVAHWKLDEAEGESAADSAVGHDGTLHGNPLWKPTGGMAQGALEFDGAGDYVASDFVLNPAESSFSSVAWIRGGAPQQSVLSQQSGRSWLGIDASGPVLMTGLQAPGRFGYPLVSAAVVADGNWHHIVLSWDGLRRRLYADGVLVAVDSKDLAGVESAAGGLYLGAGPILQELGFWTGLIDDVRIYDRVLSHAEISDMLCPQRPRSDLSGDCKVDFADLAILVGDWLECNLPEDMCRNY